MSVGEKTQTINDTDIIIMRILADKGEMTVSELYYEVVLIKRISYPAVRSHIRKLRKYGIVETEGRGKNTIVRLTDTGRRRLDEITMLVNMALVG